MNFLPEIIDGMGLTSAWTYAVLFLAASLLMVWRLDALLRHGLEGTALGTIVMPYCSGLGNLLFVAIVAARQGPGGEVLTNCLVNNVTNLTLVLGLPAMIWGLDLRGRARGKKSGAKKKSCTGKSSAAGSGSGGKPADDTAAQINQLSLLLTLGAVIFFTAIAWVLSQDGELDASDGLVLVALFLFWQCFQVYDVRKQNVRERHAFSPLFYLDVFILLLGAYGQYASIDWLVNWLTTQQGGFVNAHHLGWLSGWLMVLPNALMAVYYAARGRAEIAYTSQIGDGHISIPLCLGLSAFFLPCKVTPFFQTGLLILIGAALIHLLCVLLAGGLPRWLGLILTLAYGWFVATGLLN